MDRAINLQHSLIMTGKNFVKVAQHESPPQRREAKAPALVFMFVLVFSVHGAAAQAVQNTTTRASAKKSDPTVMLYEAKVSETKTAEENSAPAAITYEDGKLTVIAEDRSLAEVLAGIRQAMGADINIPAGAAGQRVWVRFGPGPARRILRDLLDSTELDYVIQASELDVDGVRSVSLTPRGKITDGAESASQLARSANRKVLPTGAPPENPEPETAPAAAETIADAGTTATTSDPANAKTLAAPQTSPVSFSQGTPGTSGNSADQMAQQLQNMYQQRRQIQIQQNQKPPAIN